MWEAELRLRLSQPKEALPFEYKALRLLKEVQQQSRAFVRKMGFNPPSIPEKEKRLTGELTKITPPRNQSERTTGIKYPFIRQALTRLATWQPGQAVSPDEAVLLQRAGQELAQAAWTKPAQYLQALQGLQRLTKEVQTGRIECHSCLTLVSGTLEKILPKPLPGPGPKEAFQHPLADQYFKRLK
jgi:hypothetical protein